MKRVFASILVLSVISGLMAGCSNSTTVSRPFESTAGFSGKETTGSSEGDVSTIAPPSETSSVITDATSESAFSSESESSSEATQPSAPEMTLSPNEGPDYLTMLQHLRQSIVSKASEYDALDNTM
ncbi:MAG: hypothetical protein J5607_01320, partial [Clostridiales bacterium]|nr:hypothetical protein [Clostridiales bacterium]